MALVQTEDLTKIYGKGETAVVALDHVHLSVEKGEFVAVMGPSGCGKSTLLHLIGGLDRPTEGRVLLDGQDLNRLSDDALTALRRRRIGFVFQFFNLIPVLSARDNVALPLLLTDLDKKERSERAEIALRVVGLEDRVHHSPRTMSGGEQQRVAIARAIVTDPDLIVADEPTGDLDARNAEETLLLLRQLKEHFGKTVVMVTHDPRALRFVDEAYHLDKGVLLEGEEADRAHEAIRIAAGHHPSS